MWEEVSWKFIKKRDFRFIKTQIHNFFTLNLPILKNRELLHHLLIFSQLHFCIVDFHTQKFQRPWLSSILTFGQVCRVDLGRSTLFVDLLQ